MAGYIRQSSFVDGDTITAAIFNNEYNQLVNAFSNTTGHAHDGTAAEGPVIGLIGDAGETSPNNKVLIDTTNNYIEFYVEVSSAPVQQLYIADGAIVPVTDSDVDLGTSSLYFKNTYTDTVTTTGNVTVGGNLTVTGNATISGNLTFGDADTDSINLAAEIDSDIIPNTDGTYDLGSATKEWQDLYIDGTANIDSLVADTADINGGTIDGSTIATSDITVGAGKTLDVSAGTLTLADDQISGDKVEGGTIAATTVTTLASTTGNITNVNATTVDTTNIEVTNLKAKDGTAAGSIADSTGVVTLASSVLTTTDINGGTIDGSTIATSDITVGASKTLDVSAGTLTLADNQISGDKVEGGTIAATTITDLTFGSLNDGTITATAFVDEDDMTSDSATLIPTQQSVKAYVDSQVTAQDLDFQGDTGGALSIDLDSETLTIAGGTGLDTVGSGNTVTVAIDSTVATLTGSQTLTNKTLTSPVINTGVSGTAVLDDDTFATATATTLATSESIKAYVDTTVAATNEVVEDTTPQLGGDLDLNSNDIIGTGNINNTGTITTDGLTVDGSSTLNGTVTISANTTSLILNENDETDENTQLLNAGGTFRIRTRSDDGSTNTERFRVSHNTGDISFYEDTGTSQALYWDASAESLGIGTTSPSQILHLKDSGNAVILIEAGNTSGSFINFADTDDTNIGQISYDHASNYMQFRTNDSERLRIDSSGNVGIGTSSPEKILHIKTSVNNTAFARIESTATNSYPTLSLKNDAREYQLTTHGGVSDSFVIYDGTAGANRLVINTSGNVGIGTSLPQKLLDITDSSSGESIPVVISNKDVTAGTGQKVTLGFGLSRNSGAFKPEAGTIEVGRESDWTASDANIDSYMAFSTYLNNAATEKMRIDSGGNVGINRTSPNGLLHMQSNSGTDSALYIQTSATSDDSIINFGDNGGSAVGKILYQHSSDSMQFNTQSSERVRIDSSGNLLVGKTTVGVGNAGIELRANNMAAISRSGDTCLYLNRISNDGGILQFRKDNAVVGNIGAAPASRLFIGSGDTGLRFVGDADQITPWNTSTNSTSDNLLDLGNTNNRFKDLYLSGTAKVDSSAYISQGALTSSSNAVAWDAAAKANAYYATTENTTFSAPSNAVEGAIISVEIAQGGTAYTVAWNTVFEFAASTAPTVTATANKTDIFSFRYNGSVWQEIGRTQNMAQT